MKSFFNSFSLPMAVFSLAAILGACSDNDADKPNPNPDPIPDDNSRHGAFVLNQGQYYNAIPGELGFYNLQNNSFDSRVFYKINGRSLGDTPQCGIQYGSKIYIGVSESSTIEVLDATSLKSIQQIRLQAVTTGMQPRSMVASNGYVYVSMFDGWVARVDTTTCQVNGRVKVGPNPEEMTLHNGLLYVPNSDGMNYPNPYGETASVVDPESMSVVRTIHVPLNPRSFMSVGGRLFLLSMGDYGNVKGGVYEINDNASSSAMISLVAPATMAAPDPTLNRLVIFNAPYQEPFSAKIYSLSDNSLSDWKIDEMVVPGGLGVNTDGTIFTTTYKMNGSLIGYDIPSELLVYTSDLKLKDRTGVGIGPACIFFPTSHVSK